MRLEEIRKEVEDIDSNLGIQTENESLKGKHIMSVRAFLNFKKCIFTHFERTKQLEALIDYLFLNFFGSGGFVRVFDEFCIMFDIISIQD